MRDKTLEELRALAGQGLNVCECCGGALGEHFNYYELMRGSA